MSSIENKLTVMNHFFMAAVQVTFKKGVVKSELTNVIFENLDKKVPQHLLQAVNSQACHLVAQKHKLKPKFIESSAIASINYLGQMTAEEMFGINQEEFDPDATIDEQPQSEPAPSAVAGGGPVQQ